jgi:hypothetical protein
VIVAPQFSINLSPSTIPVTAQQILATAALEEQPLPPPVLGQGFESGQTQGGVLLPPEEVLRAEPVPVRIRPQEPATDYVEPYEVAPENPAPGRPDQPAAPANSPSLESDADSLESALLEPIRSADWSEAVPRATTARLEGTVHDDGPSWRLATLVGTAAIASGGYRVVHGRSKRFNQRWLPVRRSAR